MVEVECWRDSPSRLVGQLAFIAIGSFPGRARKPNKGSNRASSGAGEYYA